MTASSRSLDRFATRGVRGWVWPGQLRELPRVPHTQKPSSPYSQDVGPPCRNVEHRGSVQRSRSGQVTNAPVLRQARSRPQRLDGFDARTGHWGFGVLEERSRWGDGIRPP